MANQTELWPNDWDPLEIAYFAGLFDGEGSIGIYFTVSNKHTPAQTVNITNTDIRVLARAKTLFGGQVYAHMPNRVKPTWRWHISGLKAGRFLAAIMPHLVIKKSQAEVYLALLSSLSRGKGSRSKRQVTNRKILLRDAARELVRLKQEG